MSIRHPATAAAIILCLSAAGCSEYVDRRETILSSSGEAVARNILVHQIDPWPRGAFDARIQTSGQRTARAVRRYECGPPPANGNGQGQSFNQTTINLNSAPGGPSAGAAAGGGDQGC